MTTDNHPCSYSPPYYIQPRPCIQPPTNAVSVPASDDTLTSRNSVQMRKSRATHIIPEISRKLGARAWRQVIKDWEEADPSRCHEVALEKWDPEWHRSSGESVKYGQRQMIALEFIER